MYKESDQQIKQREKSFVYHAPKGDQAERYTRLRQMANDLSFAFNSNCPPSRELSTAQIRLEEAIMHANAAIARNE